MENTQSYEPSSDEALLEFASIDDGNNSVRFEDYRPTVNQTVAWLMEIEEALG